MEQMVLFGGMFNQALFGLPLWIWILLIVILITAFSNVYWYVFFWSPLRPLHGLWTAFWNKKDTVLLSDIDMNFKLTSERDAKVIFDEGTTDAKNGELDWKEVTSGSFGTIGNDIILDLGRWTKKDSNEHHIIEEAADKWNMEHPEDQIHSFYKFMKYCEEGKITNIGIPIFMAVSWIRIEGAFPKKRNQAVYAGYIRQLAEKIDKEERSKLTNIAMYIIGGSVVVSALMIIGKFFLHKPG